MFHKRYRSIHSWFKLVWEIIHRQCYWKGDTIHVFKCLSMQQKRKYLLKSICVKSI